MSEPAPEGTRLIPMQRTGRMALSLSSSIAAIGLAAAWAAGLPVAWQWAAVAAAVALALGAGAVPAVAGYQYTAWIMAALVAALVAPEWFLAVPTPWGAIDTRNPWIMMLVIQAVMFGMGTQMSIADFAGVVRMPRGVAVGVVGQFTIMPLVGWSLTRAFSLPDEIAAGVILIGACSSGLASNVMVYLSRGNLALSVTLTAITTMLAPVMTPLWMKVLAGRLIQVDPARMFVDIVQSVIVPIGAALLHDYLKRASPAGRRMVAALAVAAASWLAYLACGGWDSIAVRHAPGSAAFLTASSVGFLAAAVVAGVAYHGIARAVPAVDRALPLLSMFGILYFTLVTTAAGRDRLLAVGPVLFFVAALHNGFGYLLGYWFSRLLGMDRTSARTVAFEVGLQNGGMAAYIAGAMGKIGTVGLAAAVFSAWMNISGSILANHWRRRPVGDDTRSPPSAD